MVENKIDPADRRLDRALQHVVRPWFPINQDVLNGIRKSLSDGIYDATPAQLLADLKNDFALFTFVVKELAAIGATQGVPEKTLSNPVELIRWGGPKLIGEVIAADKKLPQTHSLHWSEPFQVARLRETAVIASTASVLSEKKDLDPDVGFSRGVMREIGLNLIAWNYPTLFSKVLNNLSSGANLDDELSKELGFTPCLLAMRVLRPQTAGKAEEAGATLDSDEWAEYDDLCAVGEALARAENPETYPSAEDDWAQASKYLEAVGASETLEKIKEQAVNQSRRYQEALPEVFNSLENFNPKRNVESHTRMRAIIADGDFRLCPPHVQEALRSLYSEMDGYSVNKAAIQTLLKSIIPQAGFTGGCVFVIDPSTSSLRPRTVIGTVSLRAITNVNLEPGDMAVTALGQSDPLLHTKNDPPPIDGIYSALGGARKVGVLYLETPRGAQDIGEGKTIGTFNIIKQALCDVLHLK